MDAWLSDLFAPDAIEATAMAVVEADAQGQREDPTVVRARATLADCERKLAKHLDGLEAGIPADVIASRITAVQREKAVAETLLALAPQVPDPLTLDEVADALSMLHTVPELLESIDQADRAALYQALGLTVSYRRVNDIEEVRLRATLRPVDLEHVGETTPNKYPLVSALKGVDLERVGGGT